MLSSGRGVVVLMSALLTALTSGYSRQFTVIQEAVISPPYTSHPSPSLLTLSTLIFPHHTLTPFIFSPHTLILHLPSSHSHLSSFLITLSPFIFPPHTITVHLPSSHSHPLSSLLTL